MWKKNMMKKKVMLSRMNMMKHMIYGEDVNSYSSSNKRFKSKL